MNLQHPSPPLPPTIPKFSHHFSSSLHAPQPPPVTLFHWCVRVSVRVYLCKARGGANTGQRLIFVARPVCIPTACRRLGGQLLLPAPFPHPRASPESICNQPLLSHFQILQDQKPVLSFKHLLKVTGCVCETYQGEMYPKLERTLRVGLMSGLVMGSLGLTCNGIAPKMSRVKKCLPACLPHWLLMA